MIRRPLLLSLLAAATLLLPALATAGGVLADLDARSGVVAPTQAQQDAAAALGAQASWTRFGTPASLSKDGGYLATGLIGPDAATVARNWIQGNKTLFRLSSANGLELLNDARLTGSDGYAVLFQQDFGGLRAAEDGQISVGVVGTPSSGWKVAYVSSSLTGSPTLTGSTKLSAVEAWLTAAMDVGRGVSAVEVLRTKTDREWTVFGVRGFAELQRARLAALPTATNGVRQVYETLLVDNQGGNTTGYQHYIDAETGAVLLRKDLVEQSHPTSDTFTGAVPPADGACAVPKNGPWTVAPSESVGSVVVGVEAVVTANDSVIHLYRDGTIVASQDTATSPEALVYDPTDSGVGVYEVEVCDFGDGQGWIPPTSYAGGIVFNPVGTGVPYPPMWKVFPANPLLGNQAFPWSNPSTDSRELWCWEDTVGFPPATVTGPGGEACDRDVHNLASRAPWDFDVRTDTPTFTTKGNNASSAEAWFSPLTPGPLGQRPAQPNRQYVYPWTNAWHTKQTNPLAPAGCDTANLVPGGNDILAATTNLFAMHNRMHDWQYFLGFTERRWNAQDSNFGTGGTADRDPVLGDAQAGAVTGGAPSYLGRDNANMVPLPDGIPPITNMYLWQPLAGAFYAPCVDGDYDMAVIGHEYGHLTENRMIGKGGSRGGHHAGAMGESFGDFNAAEYLNEMGFVPVSGENPFAVGVYATGNKQRAIRNYGMNFPRTGAFPTPGVSPSINPLNFSNHGFDITGAQVHADGEIWSATNYDIRQALVAKYNAQFPATDQALQQRCAEGTGEPKEPLPADYCPGNRRWIQIVFDAMLLMPTAPSMLQARDAYLAADMMRFGGANQNELWLAFARRGFGQFAFSTNGLSNNNDNDPRPDFESPNHAETAVTFTATSGSTPVKARIYVGHYEARVSPIADTDPATTVPACSSGPPTASCGPANNLDNVARFVPGTYEFVVNAKGYGHVRFSRTFTGGSQTVAISMPINHASLTNGATASGDGTASSLPDLIDDTEDTNWDDAFGGPAVNVSQPQVTVDLAGTSPRSVNRVQVSAMLFSQNRFTAVRQFRIETSTNGVTFTLRLTSSINAFPGFNPRPVAPELILRSFNLPSAVNATHVRIRVLHNQCTGNPSFQGEQDNDAANDTDCRNGSPGAVNLIGDLPQALENRDDEVHIAELQVFSSTGGAGGGGDPPPPPPPGGDDCDEDDDIVKLGPAVAKPGSTITYTITFTNLGDTDDAECEIDDLLGDDLTYVSSTGGGTYDAATRTVTWKTGKVATGASRSVTLNAKVSDSAEIGSVLINRAYLGRLGLDLSPLGTATTMVLP